MENIFPKFFLQVSAEKNVSKTITSKKEQIISNNKGD